MRNHPRSLLFSRGVTLIELMVTVGILAILITVASPSFVDIIRSDRFTNQANSLVGAVNLARSEAIKRSARVTLCQSDDGAKCSNAMDWGKGWMVFVDNGATVGTLDDKGDKIIQRYRKLDGSSKMQRLTSLIGGSNFISFVGSGLTDQVGGMQQQAQWRLCDAKKKAARQIDVGVAGRARITDLTNVKDATCS